MSQEEGGPHEPLPIHDGMLKDLPCSGLKHKARASKEDSIPVDACTGEEHAPQRSVTCKRFHTKGFVYTIQP